MSLDPTSIVPSGKYISILDNSGALKVLERPNNRCVLVFDGDDAYWADGTNDLPIVLGNMAESTGQMTHVVGMLGSGRLFKIVGANDGKRFLSSEAGIVEWAELEVQGVPATGFGLIARPQYETGDPVPPAVFLTAKGLVYIDDDGAATQISNGTNGKQLVMQNGVPTWDDQPTGSASTGAAGVGLSGVVASNTSTNIVNVRAPSFTLANITGDEVKVANVNVSVDLTAALGGGGLDLGSESPSKWYYFYIISDGAGSVKGVVSEDATAPDLTNTGAYVYWALASVFRNDASGNIINFIQRGRNFYTRPITYSDPVAVTTSLNAVPSGVPLTSLVPPSVKTITGLQGGSISANEAASPRITMASDANGLARQPVSVITAQASDGFKVDYGTFRDLPIVDPASPAIYWKSNLASSKRKVQVTGYSI